MEFTLFKNIIDYFRSSMCSKTLIFTILGAIIFSSIIFLIYYFFKQNKKGISVILVFVLISLIFLINFIYDMGKKGNAPKISHPSPITIDNSKVEDKKTEEPDSEPEPANSVKTENFSLY
jgi:hypothetical protein